MNGVLARNAGICAVLGVVSLGAVLAPASSASVTPAARTPGGCAAPPAWIAAAALPQEGQEPLEACFSGESNQAKALLSVVNNRPYAQLITVTGAELDVSESSFAGSEEGALSRLLTTASAGAGSSALLLAPGADATLAIDRPAPGAAHVVHIAAASDNAFAVAAVTWTLLSTAAGHLRLPTATQSCIASVLYRALVNPPQPELALRRVHSCLNTAPVSQRPGALLRGLAARLLRGALFHRIIHRQGTEPRPDRIAFSVPASNPELINPEIRLGPASFHNVPGGGRIVERLTATGGTAPYRFYIVPEPGGPGVPSWLHLASDGILTLEPPAGAAAVSLPVEVVDSAGRHSVVFS